MNERIRELAKEAAREMNETGTYSEPKFQEKFAELIIRECLKIVEPTEDSGDEWCVTLKETAREIKEHFGVEE